MKNSKAFAALQLYLLIGAFVPATGIAASANENWSELCAKCHAEDGSGKTKMGIKLKSKDYTNPKVQEEFSDTGLLKNLLLGVAVEGDHDRMPAYKDKITVAEAKDLIALIRSFKK